MSRGVPNKGIGLVGVSLGGAATLLGNKPVDADAVVLEAVYSSIEQAVENRLAIRFGKLGQYLAPLLLWQLEPRLGIPLDKLSPISTISRLGSPVMIIAGDQDEHTLLSESKAMFKRASEPKSLWIVKGAAHQNLHRHSPDEYEKKILSFFETHLFSSNQHDI